MLTILFNGKVISGDKIFHGGVVIDGSKILTVFKNDEYRHLDGELIDCGGNYISPGFIDIHVHGCYGSDVMDATPESLLSLARFHCKHGTTSLLPTTCSESHNKIKAAVENVRMVMDQPSAGARILGVHLEGNYFAPKMAGAQNPKYLYPPENDDYMDFIESGVVRRVSAAPELPGALEMGKKLSAMGIQMSIGHSNGKHDDVIRAISAGYSSLTHIFNAQSALTSVFLWPDGGVCEAALLHDELTVECICDGFHLSPLLLKLIYKIKGSDGMVGITDSGFAGAPDGKYLLGGMDVTLGNNICILSDGSAFAGSVATMDICVRTLYKAAEIPLQEAVKICSATPARLIGEQYRIGTLAPGYDADINIFDDDIRIQRTFVLGKEVT